MALGLILRESFLHFINFRSNSTNLTHVFIGKCDIYMDIFKLFLLWRASYQRHDSRSMGTRVWYTVHCEGCIVVWLHHYQHENTWIVCWQQNDVQWYFLYIYFCLLFRLLQWQTLPVYLLSFWKSNNIHRCSLFFIHMIKRHANHQCRFIW